jgi:hypothetical protein
MTQIKTAILNELKCRKGPVAICVMVEDHGPEAKKALWEMRADDQVWLIAASDLSLWTADELAASVRGDCETFVEARLP